MADKTPPLSIPISEAEMNELLRRTGPAGDCVPLLWGVDGVAIDVTSDHAIWVLHELAKLRDGHNPVRTERESTVDTYTYTMSVSAVVREVHNDRGDLVGAVSAVAVPGLPVSALAPATTWIGWAHDWHNTDDNPDGRYVPLFLGSNDDPDVLLAEIEKRARDAQGAGD